MDDERKSLDAWHRARVASLDTGNGKFPAQHILLLCNDRIVRMIEGFRERSPKRPLLVMDVYWKDGKFYTPIIGMEYDDFKTDNMDLAVALVQLDEDAVPIILKTPVEAQVCWLKPCPDEGGKDGQ